MRDRQLVDRETVKKCAAYLFEYSVHNASPPEASLVEQAFVSADRLSVSSKEVSFSVDAFEVGALRGNNVTIRLPVDGLRLLLQQIDAEIASAQFQKQFRRG